MRDQAVDCVLSTDCKYKVCYAVSANSKVVLIQLVDTKDIRESDGLSNVISDKNEHSRANYQCAIMNEN